MKLIQATTFCLAVAALLPRPVLAQSNVPTSTKTNPFYSRFKSNFQKDFAYLEDTKQKIQKRIEKVHKSSKNSQLISTKLKQYSELKNSYLQSFDQFSQQPSPSTTLAVKRELQKIRQLEIQLLKLLATR